MKNLIRWIFKNMNIRETKESDAILKIVKIDRCNFEELTFSKVFVNGKIVGMTNKPMRFKEIFYWLDGVTIYQFM